MKKWIICLLLLLTALLLAAAANAEIASGTWGSCQWDISDAGVLTIHAGTAADAGWWWTSPWDDWSDRITSVVASENIILSEDASYFCKSLGNVTSMDLSGFNTTNVTYMNGMFAGCSGLTALDLSSFDTANVPLMYGMFYDCSGLTALDLSFFDTANVTDMTDMFNGCSGLT